MITVDAVLGRGPATCLAGRLADVDEGLGVDDTMNTRNWNCRVVERMRERAERQRLRDKSWPAGHDEDRTNLSVVLTITCARFSTSSMTGHFPKQADSPHKNIYRESGATVRIDPDQWDSTLSNHMNAWACCFEICSNRRVPWPHRSH